MDSTINPLFIPLIVVFCFLIGLIIFLPIYGYIIIFKDLYHEKHCVLASLVPFYSSYKKAEYTLGKEFGSVGVMLEVVTDIYCFFLNYLPHGTIPAYDIIGFILIVFNMWFCVMMFSRIAKSTRLIALAVFLPVIGVIVIACSKKSKYIGPAWSIDEEADDDKDEDDDSGKDGGGEDEDKDDEEEDDDEDD